MKRNVLLVIYLNILITRKRYVLHARKTLSIILQVINVWDVLVIDLFSITKLVLFVLTDNTLIYLSKLVRNVLEEESITKLKKIVNAPILLLSIQANNVFNVFYQNISITPKNNVWVALILKCIILIWRNVYFVLKLNLFITVKDVHNVNKMKSIILQHINVMIVVMQGNITLEKVYVNVKIH